MPATKPRAYQVYDIDWKQAVRALSDSNINLASPGALVIDAVVLDPYDRVLLTAQTNATENGIYQVNAAQTLLVPATDWVNINSGLSSAVNSGLTVTVTEGADYAQTTWTLTNPNPIVIGVTNIVFEPVPEASDRIGNIYFDGATIELANGASETAIAIRPNGASGLAGITVPDDAAANSFSLNIFNFANRGNVKIDTNSGDWVFDYSGNLTATGYITANYFVGDGGLLSNISGSGSDYSNANVANYLPTYSGNLASLTGNVTTTANVSASYILGNGRQLSGIYDNSNVAAYLPTYSGNLASLTGNVTTTANVSASYILGNGRQLSGIDRISNGTSNIVILDNGNVEITSGSETWFFINSGAMHCPPVSTIYAEGTGEMSLQVANNTIAEATINLGYNGAESTYIQITAEAEDERLAQFELTANDGSNNFARIITFDGNSQNYFWKFSGEGIFLVPGDIIPVANGSRSLGNVTNQWNDLYVSNNTIYLGNVPLAVTSANGLTIGGQAVLSNGTNASITTTGNVSASYFLGNGSQLTGLPAIYGNANVADYLPTYTGNIAGNIVKSGYTWTFSNTGTTTFPTGVRLSNARGPNTVNFTTDIDKSFQIETQTNATGKLWNFTTDGNLTLPQNGNINLSNGISILDGYATVSSQYLSNITSQSYNDFVTGNYYNASTLEIDYTAYTGASLLNFDIAYQAPLTANIGISVGAVNTPLIQANANIVLTANSGTPQTWTFGTDGNLTLPANMIVSGNVNFLGTDTALLNPADNTPLSLFTSGTNGTVTSFWAQDVGNLMSSNIAAFYLPLQGTQTVRIVNGTNGGNIAIYDFDKDGVFSTTEVSATGNVSADYLVVSGGIRATGASPAPTLSGFSSISTVGATGNITASGTLIANVGIITTGNITGNTAGYTIGYRDIPQVAFTGNATIAATDAGKHFYSTESTNYVLTIANNSSQVFQVGTAITVVNRGTGTITIAQGSGVSLYLAGNSTAGNRTISTYGMASLLNVAANVWMINGTGVT
jgi:hypothetical protein